MARYRSGHNGVVLKTSVSMVNRLVGSNPTLAAINNKTHDGEVPIVIILKFGSVVQRKNASLSRWRSGYHNSSESPYRSVPKWFRGCADNAVDMSSNLITSTKWDRGAIGSAIPLQGKGCGFKSHRFHHY